MCPTIAETVASLSTQAQAVACTRQGAADPKFPAQF